jgi:hypothetical protein
MDDKNPNTNQENVETPNNPTPTVFSSSTPPSRGLASKKPLIISSGVLILLIILALVLTLTHKTSTKPVANSASTKKSLITSNSGLAVINAVSMMDFYTKTISNDITSPSINPNIGGQAAKPSAMQPDCNKLQQALTADQSLKPDTAQNTQTYSLFLADAKQVVTECNAAVSANLSSATTTQLQTDISNMGNQGDLVSAN